MKQLVKEQGQQNRPIADEDFELSISETRLTHALGAKKIYGNAIYINEKKVILTKEEIQKVEEIKTFFAVRSAGTQSMIIVIDNPYWENTDEAEEKYDIFEEKLEEWNEDWEDEIEISCDFQEGYRTAANYARNWDKNVLEKIDPLIKMFREWVKEIG